MKTRKQIIEEYASKGYTLGTFDDVKESIDYVGETKLTSGKFTYKIVVVSNLTLNGILLENKKD